MADYNFNVTNGRTMDQFAEVTSPNASDTLWIQSGGSLKKIQAQNLVSALTNITFSGAGAHNAIYRGINLGTSVSDAQFAAIKAGTFDGMYVGDYWFINNISWRIMGFDYYYGTGDKPCITHHVTVMPDSQLYTQAMNDTDTTAGGYVGSKMYTNGLAQAKTTIIAAFGGDHILTHRLYLVNACVDGIPTGEAWFDSQVELPTEYNMYGSRSLSASPAGGKINPWDANGNHANEVDKSQYPAFFANPSLISMVSTTNQWEWLRSIVSASGFALVSADGSTNSSAASLPNGVRPAFSIC